MIQKNALIGRFFILFIFSEYCFSEPFPPDICVSTNFNSAIEIDKVIDGDTIILSDQRHVRLIGINTPEINHDNYSKSEPGALIARDRLAKILQTKEVYIQYDEEKFDRYGRTLAHIYIEGGINVQAILIQEGLAMHLTVPPNLKNHNCYLQAAKLAKQEKKGLWQLNKYRPQNVISITNKDIGFRFIYGTVKNVSESKSSLWINLENQVALRIVKKDLQYFNIDDLESLTNQVIEASGWLYHKNNQTRMRIRHPSNIKIQSIRN